MTSFQEALAMRLATAQTPEQLQFENDVLDLFWQSIPSEAKRVLPDRGRCGTSLFRDKQLDRQYPIFMLFYRGECLCIREINLPILQQFAKEVRSRLGFDRLLICGAGQSYIYRWETGQWSLEKINHRFLSVEYRSEFD